MAKQARMLQNLYYDHISEQQRRELDQEEQQRQLAQLAEQRQHEISEQQRRELEEEEQPRQLVQLVFLSPVKSVFFPQNETTGNCNWSRPLQIFRDRNGTLKDRS